MWEFWVICIPKTTNEAFTKPMMVEKPGVSRFLSMMKPELLMFRFRQQIPIFYSLQLGKRNEKLLILKVMEQDQEFIKALILEQLGNWFLHQLRVFQQEKI